MCFGGGGGGGGAVFNITMWYADARICKPMHCLTIIYSYALDNIPIALSLRTCDFTNDSVRKSPMVERNWPTTEFSLQIIILLSTFHPMHVGSL